MGIYSRPEILSEATGNLDQYITYPKTRLPMQLYLYDYESGKNIFSWEPSDDQWWITGFNPECKGEKAYAKNQVMIGSVQFPNGEMYEAFEDYFTNEERDIHDYVIFDDNNKTVWICWYEKEVWM